MTPLRSAANCPSSWSKHAPPAYVLINCVYRKDAERRCNDVPQGYYSQQFVLFS